MSVLERAESKPVVCIGIPTFRRSAMLADLLDQVLGEIDPFDATILVADNEVSDAVRAIVESRRVRHPHLHYLPVPERGISHNRNALIEGAYAHSPGFEWLVMYDDDAFLLPGVTRQLVECGIAHSADLVGGPTIGKFPDGYRNIFVRNSVLGWRARWPTGLIDKLQGTQNLGLSRGLFDKLRRPIFNEEFGLSGSEDHDLFRRAEIAGARQVWCDEAEIYELIVPDRLSTRSIFYRAYSSGISTIMVDRQYDRAIRLWADDAAGLVRCLGATLVHAATNRSAKAARSALNTAYYVGRIAWHLGFRAERYR